jgi:hypothetical protein
VRGIGIWLASRHVGLSSSALAAATLGVVGDQSPHFPHDVDDFSRCVFLWNTEPETKNGLALLASVSGPWKRLADHWQQLLDLYERDRDACHKLVRECTSSGSGMFYVRKGKDGRWDYFRTPSDESSETVFTL